MDVQFLLLVDCKQHVGQVWRVAKNCSVEEGFKVALVVVKTADLGCAGSSGALVTSLTCWIKPIVQEESDKPYRLELGIISV